jgi:hypothetical protein
MRPGNNRLGFVVLNLRRGDHTRSRHLYVVPGWFLPARPRSTEGWNRPGRSLTWDAGINWSTQAWNSTTAAYWKCCWEVINSGEQIRTLENAPLRLQKVWLVLGRILPRRSNFGPTGKGNFEGNKYTELNLESNDNEAGNQFVDQAWDSVK